MPRKETELSRAGWIRLQVLQKPDITLEQLQKAYDKTDYPKKDRPKAKQVLYQAKNQIQKRWGVNLEDIPRKINGQINLTGMVRLFLNKFGMATTNAANCVSYFADDGLELGPTIVSQVKKAAEKKVVPAAPVEEESPDANQDAGPRAGAPKKRRKTKKRRGKIEAEAGSHLDKYQEIEGRLDKLIADAEEMKAWPLAQDLRNARRRAGAGVLSHS